MDEQIKRALEVRDALRRCAEEASISVCRSCGYYERGCTAALMRDAAEVIARLGEEDNNG